MACMVSCVIAAPRAAVLDDVVALVDAGHFERAQTRITQALARLPADAEARVPLEFERERMRRLLIDFSLDEAAVRDAVARQIPDLQDEEFTRWRDAGLFESRHIDGVLRYFRRSPSNLYRLSSEAAARRADPRPFYDSPLETPHPHHEEVSTLAAGSGLRSVAPRRMRVTQSLTVNADAVPDGEIIDAWLPYPRAIADQQEGIRFVASTPGGADVAPESALQRTVHLRAPAVTGTPTAFSVTYELTTLAHYADVDPDEVLPLSPEASAALAPFLAERLPHVAFTDAMRLYSAQVVGDETNPYRIAQKLFAAVDAIPWAGALEYSTISNISDYALHAGHADCGQQTLLLITLLRLNGIPARWQSGWIVSDGDYNNMHDWGWLYLAPYGWLPVDVTFGRLSHADPRIADFYLGGLDAYRIAFNDDYAREFVPAKRHFRSETVDSQRGEAEWQGGNLYFDQWRYDFQWEFLPLEP
ncbi:MAG: transglutaminase-like domain-containing protein [Luteimonas sp.]